MPFAPVTRRVPVTLLESGRATTLSRRVAFGASVMAQVVAVCGTVVAISWLPPPREAPLTDRPSFLAPLVQPRPRPIEERVSYAALGGAVSEVKASVGTAPVATDKVNARVIEEKVGGGDSSVASAANISEAPQVFSEIDVDSAASRDEDSEGPAYPPTLIARNIEGSVLARFVVDTNGRPDVSTFITLESTHDLFAAAVRDVLPRMKFRPAKRNNVVVRQLVELRFSFRVVKPPAGARPRPAPSAD